MISPGYLTAFLLISIHLMIPFVAKIYEVFLWLLGDMKNNDNYFLAFIHKLAE